MDKKINSRWLRHIRIIHLLRYYGFTPYEIYTYVGWSMKTISAQMGNASGQLDTYKHPRWTQYFPKLLVPIENVVQMT